MRGSEGKLADSSSASELAGLLAELTEQAAAIVAQLMRLGVELDSAVDKLEELDLEM